MSIHILSKETTQKIAAGEVVERPASVVKELVENSIDSGASNITVEIENGGTTYIRVTDNGCGMDEEDSLLCFKTHATSKIKDEQDLFNIATLGFRGEAIPSISAVSRVTLYTKAKKSEYAMKIVNHGGEILEREKCGRPDGTTIVVEDIFYNVPARKKFLKKPSAEAAQISGIIQKYILGRPDISFRFISGGKDVYFSSGDGSLKNAIHSVYGKDIYLKLIPVSFADGSIKIEGYIGEPETARATKTMQNLFVNSRYIRSDIISNSVKQGYLNRIMPAKHPVYALNLFMPYDEIDVNVHPNKLEVRFKEEGFIQECFFKAVKQAFDNFEKLSPSNDMLKVNDKAVEVTKPVAKITNEKNLISEINPSKLIDAVNSGIEIPDDFEKPSEIAAQKNGILCEHTEMEKAQASGNISVSSNDNTVVIKAKSEVEEKKEENTQAELQLTLSDSINDYNVIGQLFNTYILVEYKDMLIMIDQHAAHERINTNLMLKELENSKILKQKLMLPYTLQLSAEDFINVMECQEQFFDLGFEIEEFGNNVVRINTVPHIFGEENVQGFFLETLDAIKNNPKLETRKHVIFQTACKHSIKAGQRLTDKELNELINISLKDKSPLNCPHGRPVVIIHTKKEIEKWFMRIV